MNTAIIKATKVVRDVKYADVDEESGLAAPFEDVVDVLGYRSMRLTLRILALKGSTPQAGILMETGMDAKDDASFLGLGHFDLIGTGPITIQRTFTDMQHYVRWRVFVLEGSDAEICFTIEGVVYE